MIHYYAQLERTARDGTMNFAVVARGPGGVEVGRLDMHLYPDAEVAMRWDERTQRAPQAPGVWLSRLFVAPQFRRQGVATHLVGLALDTAKSNGATHGWTDEHVTWTSEIILKAALRRRGAQIDFTRHHGRDGVALALADFYWMF